MKQGQQVQFPDTLEVIAERTAQSIASLPTQVRQIRQPPSIPVEPSAELAALTQKTQQKSGRERMRE